MRGITVRPEGIYTYTGNIRSYGMKSWVPDAVEIVCRDLSDEDKAPVKLEVRNGLRKYLEELFSMQVREGLMQMAFHYNQWCELRAIDVLGEDGTVVKHITPTSEWRPFIGEIVPAAEEETEADGEH